MLTFISFSGIGWIVISWSSPANQLIILIPRSRLPPDVIKVLDKNDAFPTTTTLCPFSPYFLLRAIPIFIGPALSSPLTKLNLSSLFFLFSGSHPPVATSINSLTSHPFSNESLAF